MQGKLAFWNNLGPKTLIAIAVVLCVVFAVVFLLLPSQTPQQSSSGQVTPTQTQEQGNRSTTYTSSSQATSDVRTQPSTLTYTDPTFMIRYSSSWNVQKTPTTDGAIVRFTPNDLPAGVNYPVYSVEVENSASPQKMPQTVNTPNYSAGPFTLDGVIGNKVSTSLPTHQVSGVTVQVPLQVTMIELQRSNKSYVLEFEYPGSTRNQALDDYFMQILQTFRFR